MNRQGSVYAYPRLSTTDLWLLRLGGAGLGNLMFNWARCLSRCRRNGWRMIWPTWFSFKPKNWRVNPYDHRTYGGLFRPTGDYVSGINKVGQLMFRKWVPEAEADAHPPAPGRVVQFRGMTGKFKPFREDLELIRSELLAITQEIHLAGYRAENPAPVAVHVRLGDFVQQGSFEEMVDIDNSVLPLGWYISLLESLREKAGTAFRSSVFSDGEDADLAPLLAMENVRRVEFGSSIADMLAMSRSRLLITSGSTFSQWASYLGQVPAIWHPGKFDQSLLLDDPELELEWAPGDSLPDWVPDIVSGDRRGQAAARSIEMAAAP